jgi:hypothetical protein
MVSPLVHAFGNILSSLIESTHGLGAGRRWDGTPKLVEIISSSLEHSAVWCAWCVGGLFLAQATRSCSGWHLMCVALQHLMENSGGYTIVQNGVDRRRIDHLT